MKVLMVNNHHFYKGGACRAYFDTIKILEQNGHEVAHFSTSSEKNLPSPWSQYFVRQYDLANPGKYSIFQKMKIVGRIWYNFESRRKLRKLLQGFKPDVAHLHNIYHHLSPSVIDELKKHDIPIVMTLHDFKLVCPNYDLFAHGDVYDRCRHGRYYQCVIDKCVKNSYLQSLVCMVEAYLHKMLGIYEKVDVLTAPSRFFAQKAGQFGFKGEIKYLPNPLPEQEAAMGQAEESKGPDEKFFLFFGQLGKEKGLDDLLKAYAGTKVPEKLYILGDGPEKGELEALARKLDVRNRIKLFPFGTASKARIHNLQRKATAIVSPSRCYENAPYSVLEAMQLGVAVICPDRGGSKELVGENEKGFLFKHCNVGDLARALREVSASPDARAIRSAAAKEYIQANYSPEVFYFELIKLYRHVQAVRKFEAKKP